MPKRIQPPTDQGLANARVRALVVLDPIGTMAQSADDEFDELVERWRVDYGLDLSHAKRRDHFAPDDTDGVDLVIFDWGGMSIGNDLMGHQLRHLIQWAEDHPSGLVVILSGFAWQYVEHDISEDLPPNVIQDNGDMTLPAWWLDA